VRSRPVQSGSEDAVHVGGVARWPGTTLKPLTAPGVDHPSVCPHCWMVNPGPFRLCARCGASMETCLQESGGLRRTAPVQSPMPVHGSLSRLQRLVLGLFLMTMAVAYLSQLLPPRPVASPATPTPASGLP